jgi:hypothetical protein
MRFSKPLVQTCSSGANAIGAEGNDGFGWRWAAPQRAVTWPPGSRPIMP